MPTEIPLAGSGNIPDQEKKAVLSENIFDTKFTYADLERLSNIATAVERQAVLEKVKKEEAASREEAELEAEELLQF